jgi:hypothetical protein
MRYAVRNKRTKQIVYIANYYEQALKMLQSLRPSFDFEIIQGSFETV